MELFKRVFFVQGMATALITVWSDLGWAWSTFFELPPGALRQVCQNLKKICCGNNVMHELNAVHFDKSRTNFWSVAFARLHGFVFQHFVPNSRQQSSTLNLLDRGRLNFSVRLSDSDSDLPSCWTLDPFTFLIPYISSTCNNHVLWFMFNAAIWLARNLLGLFI